MPDTTSEDPRSLLAQSAKIRLYAVLRRTRDPQKLKDMLPLHLRWMAEQERAGTVFLSGPMAVHDGAGPDGLTILRMVSLEAADDLIRTDPLVASGVVGVDVREWTANEGRLTVSVTLSDSRCSFP